MRNAPEGALAAAEFGLGGSRAPRRLDPDTGEVSNMNEKEDSSSSTHVSKVSVLAAVSFLACGLPVVEAAEPKPFDL